MNIIKEYVTGKVADYSLANFIINPERVNDDMILEDWIEKLTEYGFAQPYKCYVVNLKYISGISKDERDLFLSNNEKIPLSKFYKKAFIDNYYRSLFKLL